MKIYDSKRAKYRKSISKTKSCQFCDTGNIKNQQCQSLSGEFWIVMVNKYPYMDGNLMIIPKRHVCDIEKLNGNEKTEFFDVLEKTKKKLEEIFKTKDFNIGLNIGKLSGASIKHIHWQIIPRKAKIQNSTNIFADIEVITISPLELKKLIDKE